jgi:hypothetical protein
MDWSTWFQDVAGSVIDKAATAKYQQPYEIDRLRLQALGQNGYYTEGQPGARAATGGMNPGTLLLIGGGLLVAFLVMKD